MPPVQPTVGRVPSENDPPGTWDFGQCEGHEVCPGDNPAPADELPTDPGQGNPGPGVEGAAG
ncbi:hypothetical protein [Mycobacterium sp. 141]|uniref:hypothetical protein n=1 Tax=Mycobacterium sp. 141 TaxID=1120797 RepID=UPI0012DBF9C2|nr:hypothetical protein [Mycobacterium sp. 141]